MKKQKSESRNQKCFAASRSWRTARLSAFCFLVSAFLRCGKESPSPTAPAPPPVADTVVVIVGNNGGASFNPNPASGRTVAWTNGDHTTHHIVANDGSFDSGNIAPGASSTVTVKNATAYHCVIHPTMVGSVK